MATSGPDLNPRQHVAAELKRLRKLAGISGYDLAIHLTEATSHSIDQSRISRIESGRAHPSADHVRAWALECGASPEEAAALEEAAWDGSDRTRPWRTSEPLGTVQAQERVGERERDAKVVRSFQPALIPGLLQTESYIRELFTMLGVPDADKAIRARLTRQAALLEEGKTFEFILTEGALRWRPGSVETLVGQLRHVLTVAELPTVTVRVLPFSVQAPAPYEHKFALYEERASGGLDLVETETVTAEVTSTRESVVRTYRARLGRLRGPTVAGSQMGSVVSALISALTATLD